LSEPAIVGQHVRELLLERADAPRGERADGEHRRHDTDDEQ
jgi:hypothetical protein